MAIRNVPPADAYNGAKTATNRQSRSFAALYEQARKASTNDNPAHDDDALGQDARQNSGRHAQQDTRQNTHQYAGQYMVQDNARNNAAAPQNNQVRHEENRRYIEDLHERVDTLRGEILVRVIQAGNPVATREKNPVQLTGDISRLSNRLNSLRKKLHQEETRLSGKLVDVEI